MTTKTSITRSIRLAIGTAAVLALMSQAAQAKPIMTFQQGVPVHESASTLVRKGTYMPVRPANDVAGARATDLDNPRSATQFPFHQLQSNSRAAGNAGSSTSSINWAAVSVGLGILVAFGLICAAAMTGGRRGVPRSA
jgi:hypothetical protein